MTPEEFKEYINHAHSTGRNLTSDLADDIIKKMNAHIINGIESSVNGKIKAIDHKIDAYIKDDCEWKKKVTPIIEDMEKQQSFFSVGATILKAVVLIGAVGTTIFGALHFIKDWLTK